jgi:hypothetical protein
MTIPDDLIERLNGYNPPDRTVPEQRQMAQDIADAAAALVQLRDSEALARDEIAVQLIEIERIRAERDAAFALLRVCKDSVHPDTKIVIEALIT